MSCWVVPSLAAELWHIPLEQLLRGMRDGAIPIRHEEGFTFVDMAKDGPRVKPPPTFVAVAEEEDPPPTHQPPPEPEEGFEDETASKELGDWRAARRKASKLRTPPPRQPPLSLSS